jgi:hypothetical protein
VFYHVFAKTGGWITPGACDLTEESEVIDGYYVPFLKGDVLTVNGMKLIDKDIPGGLRIFRTSEKMKNLVAAAKPRPSGKPAREYDAVRNNPAYIDKAAKQRINGRIKMSGQDPKNTTIHIEGSTFTNSPVTGSMNQSDVTITVNKPEIEEWLRQITVELEKNNVYNGEMKSAIETIQARPQDRKAKRGRHKKRSGSGQNHRLRDYFQRRVAGAYGASAVLGYFLDIDDEGFQHVDVIRFLLVIEPLPPQDIICHPHFDLH